MGGAAPGGLLLGGLQASRAVHGAHAKGSDTDHARGAVLRPRRGGRDGSDSEHSSLESNDPCAGCSLKSAGIVSTGFLTKITKYYLVSEVMAGGKEIRLAYIRDHPVPVEGGGGTTLSPVHRNFGCVQCESSRVL